MGFAQDLFDRMGINDRWLNAFVRDTNGDVALRVAPTGSIPGVGYSPLASYPTEQIKIMLNPDGLTFSIIDDLDLSIVSNGQQRYDGGMTFPTLPNQTVENGFGRPVALRAYDDGVTIQYEWTYGIEIDLMGLIPPINFADQQRPGAILLTAGVSINFSGSQKTIGVDSFDNGDDRRRQRFDTIYEEWVPNTNAGYSLLTDGSTRITNRVEIRIAGPDGYATIPAGYNVDLAYVTGLSIAAGDTQSYKVVRVLGVIYLVPIFSNPQGVIELATVNINNGGGTDWVRGTDPLDDPALTVQIINTIPGSYIGEYVDLTDLTAGSLYPTEGQRALVGGVMYEYLVGTWVAGGTSGGGSTFTADTADDFTTDSGPVPVRLDSGQLRHIYKDYGSTSYPIIGGGFVYPATVQLDQRTQVQIAMNNNLFPDQIFVNVAVFDTAQGKMIPASNGSYPLSNVDTSLPPTGLRIDKTHVAVGYVDLSANSRIAVLEIPNNTTIINLISNTVIQADCTAFRITKSWNGDNALYNVPKIIAYAGFQTTTTEGFFGNIEMNYFYELLTPNTTSLPSFVTQSDWDGFMFSGMEANGDVSCLIFLKTGNPNIILVNPRTGGFVDDEVLALGGNPAISMKYVQDTHFCLMEMRATNDIVATIINISGSTIALSTGVSVAFGILNRVIDNYSCDFGVFHNRNGFDNTVLEFVCCTDDGAGAKTFEIFQSPYVGNVIGAALDTFSVACDQSDTAKQISVCTYRDDEVYGTRSVSLNYINNTSEGFSLYQFTSQYQSANQLRNYMRNMPQYGDCVGFIEGGVGPSTTVTVYGPGSHMALSGANGRYYASPDGNSVVTTPTNLRAGYGIIGSNLLAITLDNPEEKELVYNGTVYSMSLITSYLLYGQQALDFDMGTFPKLYTPKITIKTLNDNCSITIDNFDMSCMDISNMPTNIRHRPSLFSKKGSYMVIQKIFDHCDDGWYVVEDGRDKDIAVRISPANTDMYVSPDLYVPRRYAGYKKIEFGSGSPGTEIIESVASDDIKLQLIPVNSTNMTIDFTPSSLPPDVGQIMGPNASTTFAPEAGNSITIEKFVQGNGPTRIWSQQDANTNI